MSHTESTQSTPQAQDEASESGSARPTGASRTFDIFVSYRVRPDEYIANAVKVLLESALSPKPRVFVSGIGGIQSSNLGFREQIQNAVTTARAVVAVITKNSLEREWIFFEAGAAFGRNIFYAPLLFGISPGELPSSIASYQATDSTEKSKMLDFLRDIAQATGLIAGSHIGKSFEKFSRAIKSHDERDGITASDLHADVDATVADAFSAMRSGAIEEGLKLFDGLVERATTAEEKAGVRCKRAFAVSSYKEDEERSLKQLLLDEEPNTKSTAIYNYWMGHAEDNPLRAIRHYELALERDGDIPSGTKGAAIVSLARQELLVGRRVRGLDRLLDALRSPDRELKARAAQAIYTHLRGADFLTKLILCVEMLEDDLGIASEATDFFISGGLIGLAIYSAVRNIRIKDSGTARLNRGRARHISALSSLAFSDYRSASASGISVAKANMALLLGEGAVSEAGLEILRAHEGEIDSADPAAPYDTRARLERHVHEETKKEKELYDQGEACAAALRSMANDIFASRASVTPMAGSWSGRADGVGMISLSFDDDVCRLSLRRNEDSAPERKPLVKSEIFPAWYGDVNASYFVIVSAPNEEQMVVVLMPQEKTSLLPVWISTVKQVVQESTVTNSSTHDA